MRVLLDECVDQRFRKNIVGHDVTTVQEAGWAGKKNGELLALASKSYDVFLTVDRNLYFQQNRYAITIAVLVLAARTNRLVDLKPLTKDVLSELSLLKPGQISIIPKESR